MTTDPVSTPDSGTGQGGGVPADVLELLEQLEDIYCDVKVALAAARALSDATAHRQERVLFASRWADLPQAREILAGADDALCNAAIALEDHHGDALTILLQAGLAVFAELAVARTPRRAVIAGWLDRNAPLTQLRARIAALDIAAVSSTLVEALDDSERWGIEHSRSRALAAIDHTTSVSPLGHPQQAKQADANTAAASSLAELIGPGYPGDDDVIESLAELAPALISALRPRRVPALPAGPLQ